MSKGRAPIGKNGKPMNLHHMGQNNNGSIAELTNKQHTKYYKQLHINPNSFGSDINRPAFDAWRKNYWKNRAKEF